MKYSMDTVTSNVLDQDALNFLNAAQTDLERVHHSLLLAFAVGAGTETNRVIEGALNDLDVEIEEAKDRLVESYEDRRTRSLLDKHE